MSTADAPDTLLLAYRLDTGIAVVTMTGEVDVFTSGSLRDSLLRIISDENYRGLVVNLASVNFIDSTGVGVLVGSGIGSRPPRAAWPWPRRPARPGASWRPQA